MAGPPELDVHRAAAAAEQPVPRRPGRDRGWLVAVGVLLVGVVVAFLFVRGGSPGGDDALPPTSSVPAGGARAPLAPIRPIPSVPKVAAFGDSTALATAWGLGGWGRDTAAIVPATGVTGLGCSVIRTPTRRVGGNVIANDPTCNDWEVNWANAISTSDPDIAVVQTGPWEITDRQIPGDDTWRGPGDPVFDEYLKSEMGTAIDVLSAQGATVVWLTSPLPGPDSKHNAESAGYDVKGRMQHFNELVQQLPTLRPGRVVVVDLAAWVASLPLEEDLLLRPDGTHFSEDTAPGAVGQWLGPAIVAAARQQAGGAGDAAPPSGAPQASSASCRLGDGCAVSRVSGIEPGWLPAGYASIGDQAGKAPGAATVTRTYETDAHPFAGKSGPIGHRVNITYANVDSGAAYQVAGLGAPDARTVEIGGRSVVVSHEPVHLTEIAADGTKRPYEGQLVRVSAVISPGVQVVVMATGLSDDDAVHVFTDLVLKG